jgi:hypothetical protein
VQLPPRIRAWQQSPYFHFVVAAIIAGGAVAFKCFGTAGDITLACAKDGLIAAGIYLCAALQESPNSPKFNKDGTVNQPVAILVARQAAQAAMKGK